MTVDVNNPASNAGGSESVEKRVEKVEGDVEEVIEEVDVVVSDRLNKLQETLDTIMSKLSAPIKDAAEAITGETQTSENPTSESKELEIKPVPPKDIVKNETETKPKKRTLRRKYR